MTIANVGYLAAFGGGFVSFLSPCVLPIVPGYLSLICGVTVTDLQEGNRRLRVGIVRDTLLFIAGFSAVFIALGLSITTVGSALFRNQHTLTRVSGVVVLLMATFLIVTHFVPMMTMMREARFHPRLSSLGPYAAPIAGAAFGFGWTPCIGPILASVLAVAAVQNNAAHGGLLLATYSVGLGLPFLITGLAFGKLVGVFAWVKNHMSAFNLASAGVLAFFGVLLLLDRLTWVTSELQKFLQAIHLGGLVGLG